VFLSLLTDEILIAFTLLPVIEKNKKTSARSIILPGRTGAGFGDRFGLRAGFTSMLSYTEKEMKL
jgi:hypothetical protein